MASNLSSIGFAFADAEEFQRRMLACAGEATERVGCGVGDYSIWRSSTGAEIWFHVAPFGTEDDARDIAGLTPFFEGESDVALEIVERIMRPDDNAFEGAFRANVGGTDRYPMMFDAVDFAVHADRELPFRCRARIVGFARAVKTSFDEAADQEDQRARGDIPLAPRAFVPVGQFRNDGDKSAPPTSEVLLVGRIAEHHELVNEVTGRPFNWLLVESHGATFDVVVEPEAVEGEVTVGGMAQVECVLFGRLLGA